MQFVLAISASLFVFSLPVDAAKRCCGPKQWTSSVSQVIGDYNTEQDFYRLLEVASTFYYDFPNKKLAAVQTVTNETTQPITTHVKQIYDYNMMKKWVIQGKNCTKMDLKDDMPTPCIPDSATHLNSQSLVGDPVDVWFIKYKTDTRARATVTQSSCTLVTSSTLTAKPDFAMTVSLYQNVTAGTIDPKIFKVPSFCQKNLQQTHKYDPPSAIPWM